MPQIADVVVTPVGPGALEVRWHIEGPPCDVEVAVGSTPDPSEHGLPRPVRAGRTSIHLEDLGPGRHYVSVAVSGSDVPVVAAERRVAFDGVVNFRDLGGYRGLDGRRTRWGLVFRADSLHGLTESDLTLYTQLGMRAVYDLRGDAEREVSPGPFPARHLPFLGPSRPSDPDAPVLASPTTAEEGEALLRTIYLRVLEIAGPLVGEIFTGLLSDDGLPAVFHCANGKDRTGLAAALLLEALGVDREDVLDDYELTARFLVPTATIERLVDGGMTRAAAAAVMGVSRPAMVAALEELDATYGGVVTYLREQGNVSVAELDGLRDRLLTG